MVRRSGRRETRRNPKPPKPSRRRTPISPQKRPAPAVRVFQGGFFGGIASGMYLVRRPDVQEELKISDEQKAKLEEAFGAQQQANRDFFTELRGLDAEERKKKAP